MRSSLSAAGRRAGVLAAAALVCLTTAACDPAGLQLGATAPSGAPDASSQAGTASSAPLADAAPSSTVPAPVPTPPAEVPAEATVQPPVEAPVETPAAEATEPTEPTEAAEAPVDDAVTDEADDVVAEDVPAAPQAAAAAGTGRSGAAPTAGRSSGAPASAAAAATAAGGSTGGSGGSYTDQPRQSFRAGNGQTGNYLVYAGGIDPARAVGLVVYVDGTGEYGVDNPDSSYALGGPSGLVATSRARNMVTLAVESPNQSCECWHTGDTAAYADFLAELVERQLAAYPVTEVWLAGFSSGAQEITRFLVPRHPELMRLGGGWVVFGGGGPPADGGAAVTAARMAGVRGHWFTGTADTAVPLTASWGAQAGERFYADRGVVTSHEWPAGVGHGLDGRLGRTVGQLVDGS
ncbi:hypothetical protein SAMN04488107_2320 [Geodermatophilus saharensis]|uniref:Cutinase n=1 Tax=Geodermatophilus saharensis TaxID=1137994 RepID=A0A239E2M4_9ACTN|nr:hypothetical protein [Geodermatophilus saharensis]SNS38222.1 hypothetical protein SAMN04488107_2320 [Geodermatophilus saharensis]